MPIFSSSMSHHRPDDEPDSVGVEFFGTELAEDSESYDSTKFRTPRKREQEPFLFVASRYHERTTLDEIRAWLIKTGNDYMTLTGQYTPLFSVRGCMGPFKKARVLIVYIFSFCLCCVLTCYVCSWLGISLEVNWRFCSNRLPLSTTVLVKLLCCFLY